LFVSPRVCYIQASKIAEARDQPQRSQQSPHQQHTERVVGTKKTGKGRRKVGRKKRRMRSKIRHRKG
jgi:hypothetical protein